MSENTKTPRIRFKGFTDAWEQRKLGEVTKINMGQSPAGVNYTANPNDAILVQGNADMVDGWVCPRVYTRQITKKAHVGDLIFSVRAPVGEVGKTQYDVVIGRGVAAISGNEFIFQTLKQMNAFGYWTKLSAGSTFESINSDTLKSAKLFVPKENEQRKIGEILLKIDNLITLHQRKCDKLKNIKAALLEKMFPQGDSTTPKIRFKGFTDTWEQRKLGEVGKAQSGVGFPDREQGGKTGVPFYKVSDMNNAGNEHEMCTANNYVSEAQCKKNGWTPITEISVVFAKVGAAIMLNRKRLVRISFLLDNNTMAYKFGTEWDIDFGKTLFERIDLTDLVQIGALPSYNATDVECVEISLPDKPEQHRIGVLFKQLDNLITLHQRKQNDKFSLFKPKN